MIELLEALLKAAIIREQYEMQRRWPYLSCGGRRILLSRALAWTYYPNQWQ